MVYRPHGTRFHVDFARFPGAGEFAGGRGTLVE